MLAAKPVRRSRISLCVRVLFFLFCIFVICIFVISDLVPIIAPVFLKTIALRCRRYHDQPHRAEYCDRPPAASRRAFPASSASFGRGPWRRSKQGVRDVGSILHLLWQLVPTARLRLSSQRFLLVSSFDTARPSDGRIRPPP